MLEKDQVVVIAKSAIYHYSSEAIVEIMPPSGVLLVTDNGTKHYFSPCGWWEAVEKDG